MVSVPTTRFASQTEISNLAISADSFVAYCNSTLEKLEDCVSLEHVLYNSLLSSFSVS
jgi:hypothetical protein